MSPVQAVQTEQSVPSVAFELLLARSFDLADLPPLKSAVLQHYDHSHNFPEAARHQRQHLLHYCC